MNNASHLENAENCVELALDAKDEPSRRRFERLATSWRALAETQDWLDGKMSIVEESCETESNDLYDLGRTKQPVALTFEEAAGTAPGSTRNALLCASKDLRELLEGRELFSTTRFSMD